MLRNDRFDKLTEYLNNSFSHQKITCLPSWDISAIKHQHVCFPGAFQPSKSSIVGPWAVAAIKKQHVWLLGSFSYQKTAFLAPGPFQPSKNSMFASLGWFNRQKTALLACLCVCVLVTQPLRGLAGKGLRGMPKNAGF